MVTSPFRRPARPRVEFSTSERRLFERVGTTPSERTIPLARTGGELRVNEVGDGPTVVFLHGAVTAGACWADLAARLPDFRCVLVDRPGCGLSPPLPTVPTTRTERERAADALIADVLDGLEVDRAHLVSNSLGGWYAFRGAAAHPDRVGRIVGMGFQVGARVADAPWFMRVQAPPWLVSRIPMSASTVRRMLGAAGMRAAIESGRFDDDMVQFMVALLRETDTMVNDMRASQRPIDLRGPVDATRHAPELLSRVVAPTHLFWGTDDPFGGEDAASEFAAALPDATHEMIDGAGHAPWIDDLEAATDAVRRHLSGSA